MRYQKPDRTVRIVAERCRVDRNSFYDQSDRGKTPTMGSGADCRFGAEPTLAPRLIGGDATKREPGERDSSGQRKPQASRSWDPA